MPDYQAHPYGRLFSLAFRTEAIIPIDICMLTLRTKEIDWDQNVVLTLAEDQSEERRRQASIQIVAYQHTTRR